MNNTEVLDWMLERLGGRRNFSRSTLLLELNAKIKEFERGSFLPWFLEGLWETTISTGTSSLALPTDFLQEVENGALELVAATGRFVYPKKRPFEAMQLIRQNFPEGGVPSYYSVWGGQLHVAPTPLSDYALTLPYFKKTPEVTDAAVDATSWLAEATNFISYSTLADVSANELKDDSSASKFRTLAAEAYARLYRYNEARQHTNADYVIGEDS
jgi:hypothetical protein